MRHLTVMSYNIHRGVGLDRRRDLDRIAEVIAETAPDVVGLQEVIRENGVPHADQAAYIASRLGMSEIVMGETRAHGAGTYGNVVLTKVPVLGSGRCDLSCGLREPRGCLRVDLDIEGAPVHVFNCHFGLALSEAFLGSLVASTLTGTGATLHPTSARRSASSRKPLPLPPTFSGNAIPRRSEVASSRQSSAS